MQPRERWYQGKASPPNFARSSSKGSHVRFVAGDPSVNCSFGNVSHGHRDGRLQEKTSLAFFNKNHGVAKLIETQFATEGSGQCKRATFAQRNGGCHAAMLHRSNAILKCKLRNSALVSLRRYWEAGPPASDCIPCRLHGSIARRCHRKAQFLLNVARRWHTKSQIALARSASSLASESGAGGNGVVAPDSGGKMRALVRQLPFQPEIGPPPCLCCGR